MLEYLNRQITNLRYGYTEIANKPKAERISGNEKKIQSGILFISVQLRLLPLMVGMRFMVLATYDTLYLTPKVHYNYAASNRAINVEVSDDKLKT